MGACSVRYSMRRLTQICTCIFYLHSCYSRNPSTITAFPLSNHQHIITWLPPSCLHTRNGQDSFKPLQAARPLLVSQPAPTPPRAPIQMYATSPRSNPPAAHPGHTQGFQYTPLPNGRPKVRPIWMDFCQKRNGSIHGPLQQIVHGELLPGYRHWLTIPLSDVRGEHPTPQRM